MESPSSKRPKRGSIAIPTDENSLASAVFFPDVSKISYKPQAAAAETMVFKHYNADEVINGKTMAEWLRFSVCYWHTFRGQGADPFGLPTISRPWDDGSDSLFNAKRRMHAAFEFMSKLGVKYWSFHDRDIAPEGSSLEATNKNLDELVDLAEELMARYNIKLLWNTCNLFAHPRYMNGALTNPDAHVFAYAAAQVKKGLDVAKRLGAKNFVFWGGREGYSTLLNTDIRKELDHMANFFKMVISYKTQIGFDGQLLIEPKAKEPTRHQYDYDAMTVIAFLKTYNLEKHFKINVEPNHTTLAGHPFEHDIAFAAAYNMLGSIDSNTGSADMGWDTDQFPMDIRATTAVMQTVLDMKGIAPGGLNFDAKVRRESIAINDMFIAHIGAMDAFARGLRNAARMQHEAVLSKAKAERYNSFKSGIGAKIEAGTTSLEELADYVTKTGEPEQRSAAQEHYEGVFNYYI
ncbi:xylose isomerase-like [Watersipora subatra]|uniref:xylose isomerase-like n=1 Tax=Watersipora subatra TaxID=2589382 RepID=UPI00355C1321